MHISIYIHTYIHTYIHINICVWFLYVCMYVCSYVYMHMSIHSHRFLHVYINILHMNTFIYILSRPWRVCLCIDTSLRTCLCKFAFAKTRPYDAYENARTQAVRAESRPHCLLIPSLGVCGYTITSVRVCMCI